MSFTGYQRLLCLSVIMLVLGALPATEVDPRVQHLIEALDSSATATQKAHDKAVQKADDDRTAALLAARDRTIDGLKRLITSRSGIAAPVEKQPPGAASGPAVGRDFSDLAEQAEIYAQVLRLNREDPDAVRFLTAVGPITQAFTGVESIIDRRKSEFELSEALAKGAVLSLWNQHNSGYQDRGSDNVQVQFFSGTRLVHTAGPLVMPWAEKSDEHLDIALPSKLTFDRVRIEVLSWRGAGGGLSEIQIISKGKNLLAKWKSSASESYSDTFDTSKVIDGITTSANYGKGYWLLPDNTNGWIELTSESTAAGTKPENLGF